METLLLSIFSLLCSFFALGFSVRTHRESVAHDRKQATLDAYNQLQEQVLDKLYTYKPAYIREIAKDKCSEEYKIISTYIARIEHFCVGIEEDIYDMETMYKLSHGFFDASIKYRIMPIIELKNRDSKEYYINTLNVLENMEDRSKKWYLKERD